MSKPIVSVEGLSKSYVISHRNGSAEGAGGYRRLSEELLHHPRRILSRLSSLGSTPDSREEFWALKDVSFDIQEGDVVGVIGRNGAGKSTLLKILSRITEPTSGRAVLRGRVASLLEVGTGFHPELTGRENIFLNGAILGMSRTEIKRKFDEIVDFAEVEKFLDTPVKRYSSGMYVRLAFSVAAHLDPEILVVDEVLAVGDLAFQEKCLSRMRAVSQGGKTVILVSHNMAAIASLSNSAVLLERGVATPFSNPLDAVHRYQTSGRCERQRFLNENHDSPGAQSNEIKIKEVAIYPIKMTPSQTINVISVTEPCEALVRYELQQPDCKIFINLHFKNQEGVCAFATIQNDLPVTPCEPGEYVSRVQIPANWLNAMEYSVSLYASSFRPTHVHVELQDILRFTVIDDANAPTRQGYHGPFPGVTRPLLSWTTCRNHV